MHISVYFSRLALLILLLNIAITCSSQPRTSIGLNLTGERTSSPDYVAGFGGTFERQFSKHHGIETGLYFRTFALHNNVYVNYSLYGTYTVKERYLSVPVLYKYYSTIVNFSIGPTFDIYTGWNWNKESFPTFYADNKFQVGLLGKVSKTIPVSKRFFLEPEARFNRIFYEKRFYYGIGIQVKYALSR